MRTAYFAAIFVVLIFFLYMMVATIGKAHDRRIAVLDAVIGAAAGAGFVVACASVVYVDLHFGAGDYDGFGRGLLAGFVVFFATSPAFVLGLIGCAIRARRGADWRPNEPFTPDKLVGTGYRGRATGGRLTDHQARCRLDLMCPGAETATWRFDRSRQMN
jgi:hypothetical protein